MALSNSTPNNVELYLATQYTDGDTTLDCYAKSDTYKLTDQKTSSLITSFRCIGISRTDNDSFMNMAVSNVVENGTFQGNTRYTLTLRLSDSSNPMVGLANTDDGTDSDSNIITANKLATLPADSLIQVTVDSGVFTEMYDTFNAGTTTNISITGEALSINETISLHTDGKVYKYNSVTYPSLVGIVNADTASGEQATYTTYGGVSSGHSGLTIGSVQYAENTGSITEVPSITTKYLGIAQTATTIRVAPSTPIGVAKASGAEVEAGTDDVNYVTSEKLQGNLLKDTVFSVWNDNNYISTAPTAPTIVEGVAGAGSYTSVIVKLAYKSDNGQYTECSSASNTLSSVVSKKIDIPLVASADTGCSDIGIWLDIDGAGYQWWKDATNANGTESYNNEALSVITAPATNGTKLKTYLNTENLEDDLVIDVTAIPQVYAHKFTSAESWSAVSGLSTENSAQVLIDTSLVTDGEILLFIDGLISEEITAGDIDTFVKFPSSSIAVETRDALDEVDSGSYASKTTGTLGFNTTSFYFHPSGTQMFVLAGGDGMVHDYTLSTAFDVSTVSATGKTFDVSSQIAANAYGLGFSIDGTKMYVCGADGVPKIFEYDLGTAWDISTAVYNSSNIAVTGGGFAYCIRFNTSGTSMYITTSTNVAQYALSTAWDVSTATAVGTKATGLVSPRGLGFDETLKRMYVSDPNTDVIKQFNLSTRELVSSASAGNSLDISGQDGTPNDVFVFEDELKMYLLGDTNNAAFQYTLSSTLFAGTAGAFINTK